KRGKGRGGERERGGREKEGDTYSVGGEIGGRGGGIRMGKGGGGRG
ncbi:H/ACA ribonucleoprotein complex subunit 1-like, partial [Penaeus monodon]